MSGAPTAPPKRVPRAGRVLIEHRNDGFTAAEDRYAGYAVYDQDDDKIGTVDDLFVDENDQPEYIGVKMGFLRLRSTLIPIELVRMDEEREALTVLQSKSMVKDGPTFDDDEETTPEFEEQVRNHYGLQTTGTDAQGGAYGEYYDDEARTEDRKDGR